MVCLSCMQKKSGRISKKKDINSNYMSYKWAIPTWYFFHTFAEKINPVFYKHNAASCFNIIRQVCYNLPCPDCRYHASNYINRIKLRDVSTKEDLKFVLFTFHNFVNQRLGKPIFALNQLELYRRANTRRIFNIISDEYYKKPGNN